MTTQKPDIKQIKKYLKHGYPLIRLHPRNKHPVDNDWTNIPPLTKEEALAHAEGGGNIGVLLRDTDLILDVDPRNYAPKDDSLKRLSKDIGVDLESYITVITGGGGKHAYFRKPANVKISAKLDAYPGLDFKTKGGQVVAAGSIHPSGKPYEFDMFGAGIGDVTDIPEELVALLTGKKKSPESNKTDKNGVLTPEQLENALSLLDAMDFNDRAEWLDLMMACHHATGGKASKIFAAWSATDPEYADREQETIETWNSLKADGNPTGQITYKTLLKIMRDKGHEGKAAELSAQIDYAGIDDGGDIVSQMNARFCVVNENAKFRVYEESLDIEFDPPRKRWLRYGYNDFIHLQQNNLAPDAEGKMIPSTKVWLHSPRRRQYEGIVFDPKMKTDQKAYLNLWRGWSVQPKPGAWKYLHELICDVFCNGDDVLSEYVLNWAAYMVQFPERPAEVALCFMGEKGTGKSTFGRALVSLAGRHGWHIASSQQLTGRFNAHLRDCICMFADEAVAPDDNVANSRLKALITEPMITIEGKGQDLVTARNMLHIIMCSNDQWVVPMSLTDERRYFVSHVNNNRQGDKAFFAKLHAELENGGLAAMLHDLLQRDLANWHPRNDIPVTQAAIDQKISSMSPVARWWMNALISGEFPCATEDDWRKDKVRAFKEDVSSSFKTWIKDNSDGRTHMMPDKLADECQKLCGPGFSRKHKIPVPDYRSNVTMHSDGRTWGYLFPTLIECREHMDKLLGAQYPWPF